jgi:hypothetical protein
MENDSILQASRYADGEMDTQEQQQFELLLQTDVQLRGYVEQYRQAATTLKAHFTPDDNLQGLKQTLGNLNTSYFKPEEAKIVPFKPATKVILFNNYTRWASGIAALLLVGLLIFNPWRKSLYDEYSTATTMSISERGAGPQTDLEKAATFYNKKEFINAEPLLAKEYHADTKNSLVAYYYAVTLIQDNQEAKARGILQTLYNGESALKYDAAYYMALSYVKEKNYAKAKKWLNLIPAAASNYIKSVELAGKL